jgi:hypothetical protein
MQDCIEEASEVISLPYEVKKYLPTDSPDRSLILLHLERHKTIPLCKFRPPRLQQPFIQAILVILAATTLMFLDRKHSIHGAKILRPCIP